jgi:DDE superfamily endonuclease
MGPEAAQSFAGQTLIDMTQRPAERSQQEIDYGRRGAGYVFGAFQPQTGAVVTWTAQRRTTANVVAFLEQVETWIDPAVERIYVILDTLSAHRATDVLFFALAHPRPRVRLPTHICGLSQSH